MFPYLPKLACSAALAALLLAGCGRTALTTMAPDAGFQSLDTNQDGQLSPVESHLLPIKFAELDLNGDGSLSPLEWQGATPSSETPWLIQEDAENRRPPRPVGPGTW